VLYFKNETDSWRIQLGSWIVKQIKEQAICGCSEGIEPCHIIIGAKDGLEGCKTMEVSLLCLGIMGAMKEHVLFWVLVWAVWVGRDILGMVWVGTEAEGWVSHSLLEAVRIVCIKAIVGCLSKDSGGY
jgi:hypothetical protein